MKHLKISKLLKDSLVSKFLTRKWIEVDDLSGHQYYVNENIRFKSPFLRSDLWDYSVAYIVVKGTVDLLAAVANKNDKAEKEVAFKNNGPFRSCISKLNT